MNSKTAILALTTALTLGLSIAKAEGGVSESGLMAVKSVVYSSTSVVGAAAYATSEKNECNFALAPTVPRCLNSIFGLLQMELSLEGLDNSRKLAIQLLGEGHPSLLIDLKTDGFCVSPLTDGCTQDQIDAEVVSLYQALKNGTEAAYVASLQSIKTQINGKLAAFTAEGYIINRTTKQVTPPIGASLSFADGSGYEVDSTLFVSAKNKFDPVINRIANSAQEAHAVNANQLLALVQSLVSSGVISGAQGDVYTSEFSAAPASSSSETFSSKTSASKSPGQIFFAELTDTQKEVSPVAPQGEEVFGSVSSRYLKMQKSGEFLRP